MKTQIRKGLLGLLALSCLMGLGAGAGWAEDASKASARIAKWKQLKQENPEEFRRLVQERKEHLKARLRELKEKDPQKYEEMRKRMYHHRVQYLRKLRKENPEKYQEIVERRWGKLEEMKTGDPERFKEFMEKHPRVAERWEDRRDRFEAHQREVMEKGKGVHLGQKKNLGLAPRESGRARGNR